MRDLKTLADARVGERLSFAYYGGSNPGMSRTVDVLEVLDDRIIGTDVAKDEQRQYLFDKAAIIVLIHEPIAMVDRLVAEASCDVELGELVAIASVAKPITMRVRRRPLSFEDARQKLHDQIDTLNGEDLAECLAEIEGEDRGAFDSGTGEVTLETDVAIPHCEVNLNGHADAAGIDWLNEDGERITTTFLNEEGTIRLYLTNTEVTAENLIKEIAQHLGLTVS